MNINFEITEINNTNNNEIIKNIVYDINSNENIKIEFSKSRNINIIFRENVLTLINKTNELLSYDNIKKVSNYSLIKINVLFKDKIILTGNKFSYKINIFKNIKSKNFIFQKNFKIIEDFDICKICDKKVVNPKAVYPCLDIFCGDCLYNYIKMNNKKKSINCFKCLNEIIIISDSKITNYEKYLNKNDKTIDFYNKNPIIDVKNDLNIFKKNNCVICNDNEESEILKKYLNNELYFSLDLFKKFNYEINLLNKVLKNENMNIYSIINNFRIDINLDNNYCINCYKNIYFDIIKYSFKLYKDKINNKNYCKNKLKCNKKGIHLKTNLHFY